MADSRFFTNHGPMTLGRLAEVAGADLAVGADAELALHDVAPLDSAGVHDVSFLDNRRYLDSFRKSGAGACVVAPGLAGEAPAGMALLLSEQPYRAYARIAHAFYPDETGTGGHHPAAVIDESAKLGADCIIGAGAVIGRSAQIGDGAAIGAGAVVGAGVVVGSRTVIGENASLSHCEIGANCRIHPGVRIGTRGFGFDMSAEGHLDVPQLGRVLVGDDVEIGANSTIDRGAGPDTVIGDGCKIDNLVQIGHNVRMGRGCVVVAQAGIAGSTQLGDFVVLAAQSGVAGHLKIAPGTQLAARSGVMRDTQPGDKLGGNPAIPIKEFFRQVATLAKLTRGKSA